MHVILNLMNFKAELKMCFSIIRIKHFKITQYWKDSS